MSGPKVIVVVNPEQLKQLQLLERRLLLAELAVVTAAWKRALTRDALKGPGAPDDKMVTAQRREELEAAFDGDHDEAARSTKREIEFIRSQTSHIDEEHAQRLARTSNRRCSLISTAEALKSKSPKEQATRIEQLIAKLQSWNTRSNADLDAPTAELENICTALMTEHAVTESGSISQPDAMAKAKSKFESDFLKRLRDGAATIEEPGHKPEAAFGLRDDSVDLLLARLQIMDAALAAPFLERLTSLSTVDREASRQMKLDSITVEIARAVRQATEARQNAETLETLLLQLPDNDAGTHMKATVQQKLQQSSISSEDTDALQQACTQLMKTQALDAAEQKKRAAILKALADLGYSVNEGMNTALTTAGSVVIRNSQLPHYGIQLASPAGSDKMQLRVVSFAQGSAQTPDLDTNAENQWCSKFQQLVAMLQAGGFTVNLLTAALAGTTPVRRCAPPAEHNAPREIELSEDQRRERIQPRHQSKPL